ncbi:MAG: chemotaxis protein CheB [Bacteroidota bacterium]
MSKPEVLQETITEKSKKFPIVAIGASAGGLEAVTELLAHLPVDTGMAFVYIQHLDPTHPSMLSHILGRATKIPVVEAVQDQAIEPDHFYIIPPNKNMEVADGILQLRERPVNSGVHHPIDTFFSSLAENEKEASIAVVLSGNASDGTSGLKAIKLAGGITFAQDDSAQFGSMPNTAISEGVVDMVLSPKDIAYHLERISKHPTIIAPDPILETIVVEEEEVYSSIISLINKTTGVDFNHYKVSTIRRRIERRMLLYKIDTLSEYLQYLKKEKDEIHQLYEYLLINVTCFFRDAPLLEYLKKALLPGIIKNKSSNEALRIWIPACSTGEEAYSLAIIVMEVLEDSLHLPVQIYGTDLCDPVITKARLGIYTKSEVADVSPKRLEKYFTRLDGSYRISKTIRDMCIFAPHNVFRDPPFSRLDIISCCNLLIYLDTVLQKKIMATFHFSLSKNGILILGKSETIGTSTNLFAPVDKKYKIFNRKNGVSRIPVFETYPHMLKLDSNILYDKTNFQKGFITNEGLEKLADTLLLTQYVPASVVINQEMEILHFRGSTGLFLEPAPGRASLNLLKMVRSNLVFDIRNLVHKAIKSGEPQKKTGLQITDKGVIHQVTVEIIPLPVMPDEKFFIVVFESFLPSKVAEHTSVSKDKQVKQLKEELILLKEDMRSIVEEQEASVEELQSANEEIVASNEALQSINEELESSKEQMESANEELMTINAELQVRNEQLAESYEYAEAVFETIREAVLVLDKGFHVKSANEAFYKIFKTTVQETEGMLLFELGNKQWNMIELRELLENILRQNNGLFYGFEVHHHFPGIGEKYMLLNARCITQRIHGQQLILIAIEDITEHKQAQKLTAEREAWFRKMSDDSPVLIWLAGANNNKHFFNKTWLEYTGRKLDDEVNNGWQAIIHPDDLDNYMKIYYKNFKEQQAYKIEYRLKRFDGDYRWIFETAKPTFTSEGIFTGFIASCTEIHDKKLLHDELEKRVNKRTYELRESNKALEFTNKELEQYAYVASHDLQEPLRKIVTFSDRLMGYKNELPDMGKKYIDKIISSAERMSRLIDDILNFSKVSNPQLEFEQVDLNKILLEVIEDFEVIISQKNAVITHDKLPSIKGLPLQLEQMFHNLVSNALKFAKDDVAPVIEITFKIADEDEIASNRSLQNGKKYVRIIVKDNGIGIEENYLDQIFVLFQRLNERQKFPGSGIGLALCKKIVINHGGDIKVISQKEQGSAFHIFLPVEN